MDSNAYPALASIHLPAHSRLLRDSCCPDKDIVLVFSHLGGLERISLYHTHNGTKIWETDVGDEAAATSTQVVGISWSPDGRSIALLLNPPRISLLSIQDGHTISTLRINVPEEVERAEQSPLAGISWFRSENRAKKPSTIPDIFRRHNIIPGSTESILKNLPLLDPLQEESDKYTATNLFAFQGSQTRSQSKTQLPEAISSWPTLSADPKSPAVDSSIQTKQHSKPEDSLDEVDESNINSVLMVSDVLGNVYSFLDGTFPLGMINLGRQASFTAVEKSNSGPVFFGHYKFRSGTFESTCIEPTIIDMPLLVNRKMRDFARLSSIARDLTWYIIRVVQEMKSVWYGSGNTTGARDIGPRWVQTLKMKQTEQFGQKGTDPILDLTSLLTTGRASRPLEDFLGGGEQMSERGIQKWESIMSDALIKLRDYSEKRLVPACQRLQLVLEEISAWKLLPLEFGMFDFDTANYEQSIRHTNRGIVLGSLLASVARREFYRFREFIAWLRFEVANTHGPAENNVPRHDILEVNHYLMSGLGSSTIDKWFEGEKLDPTDLEPMPEAHGVELGSLASTLRRAKIAALDAKYQVPPMPTNHLKEVKSLVLISDDIAARCQSSFAQAAAAPSSARNICIRGPPTSSAEANPRLEFQFRERIEQLEDEIVNHILTPIKEENLVVFMQIRHGGAGSAPSLEIRLAVVECQLAEGEGSCSILAADFFDEQSTIVVYRAQNDHSYLSSIRHSELNFLTVPYDPATAAMKSWEELVSGALEEVKAGRIAGQEALLTRRRGLGPRGGEVGLAVNGRSQRRVVCLLDGTGTRLDTFDLGDEEPEELE